MVLIEESKIGPTKRRRVMGKDETNQRTRPMEVAHKVDALVCSDKKMGENYMRFSESSKTSGISQIYIDDDSVLESPMAAESVSCASSVGSCSANDSITQFGNKLDDYNSDAESSFGGRYEEEIVDHSSELQAYRSVLEALYASGPMSWDDQEKLMDLRKSLNISDDQHLIEIRNLISAYNTGLSVKMI